MEAAWRLSRQWDGAEEFSDRYFVAFAGLPLNVAPRGDTLGHAFGWDSFLLLVEPRAERPIIWYSLHNADWTASQVVGQYAGSSNPVKFPPPERIR